jgi:hypothetical protein
MNPVAESRQPTDKTLFEGLQETVLAHRHEKSFWAVFFTVHYELSPGDRLAG